MIDELFKDRIDRLWDAIARSLAGTGITPDGVTWTGFILCFVNSAFFVVHQNYWAFGLLAGLIELLDNLDGAVARVQGQSSRRGAYLDAVTDRYKDAFILLAVAEVTDAWLPRGSGSDGQLGHQLHRSPSRRARRRSQPRRTPGPVREA